MGNAIRINKGLGSLALLKKTQDFLATIEEKNHKTTIAMKDLILTSIEVM